jgi:hypothetical protein
MKLRMLLLTLLAAMLLGGVLLHADGVPQNPNCPPKQLCPP